MSATRQPRIRQCRCETRLVGEVVEFANFYAITRVLNDLAGDMALFSLLVANIDPIRGYEKAKYTWYVLSQTLLLVEVCLSSLRLLFPGQHNF